MSSNQEQTLNLQLDDFKNAGCDRIFGDSIIEKGKGLTELLEFSHQRIPLWLGGAMNSVVS